MGLLHCGEAELPSFAVQLISFAVLIAAARVIRADRFIDLL